MAAQKSNRGNQSKNGVVFGRNFGDVMGNRNNVSDNEKRESVPWSLLITLVAILITFFVVMPVLGFMYVDLINIREALVIELKKAKTITKQLQEDHYLLHKED
jgi:hypothetical protein